MRQDPGDPSEQNDDELLPALEADPNAETRILKAYFYLFLTKEIPLRRADVRVQQMAPVCSKSQEGRKQEPNKPERLPERAFDKGVQVPCDEPELKADLVQIKRDG